jgi:hypothetical protein
MAPATRTFTLDLDSEQELALLASLIDQNKLAADQVTALEKTGNGKTAIADYWRKRHDATNHLLNSVREQGL